MADKEIYEKILNKKFQKSVFTGYATDDVDKFFDLIIDYLKGNEADTQAYKKNADDLKKQNEQLMQKLADKNAEIARLTKIIKQYEDDGYVNVSHNKRLQEELDKKGEKK